MSRHDRKSSFEIDRHDYTVVYVGGVCLNDGEPNAKAGLGVFFAPDNTLWVLFLWNEIFFGETKRALETFVWEKVPLRVFVCYRNRYGPVPGRATKNVGEIQAANLAIQLAGEHGITKLCIRTDSEFLLNAVSHWMRRWKRDGWLEPNGYPVQHRDDLFRLDMTMNRINVKVMWEHLRSDFNVFGKMCADRLAMRGAERYRVR